MNTVLIDRIRQIAADTFNQPLSSIKLESSPDTIESWDSLTHLNFVLALEESFGCEIEPEEGEQAAKSIASAVAVVEKKLTRN